MQGIELVDLEFVEQPLGFTAERGHGYLRIEFGDAVKPQSYPEGMNSSI
jgi:hypothetical protein